MSRRVLVTGSSSGLGNFLCKNLDAIGLSRENSSEIFKNENSNFDLIIHCAFSSAPDASTENIALLNKVLEIKHNKFVFISSCDVYPDNEDLHSENESIKISLARSPYARQKIECEKIVFSNAKEPIIIRPVSLIGERLKNSNLKKLIYENQPSLTLTANSRWNFVKHEEVLAAIKQLDQKSFQGIIQLARSAPVTVGDVADFMKREPFYGNFTYKVPLLDNEFAKKLVPELDESSSDFFKNWITQIIYEQEHGVRP